MPVNPKKLIHHTITIPVGDDAVNVQFRRPSITQLDNIRKALKEAGREDEKTFAAQVEFHLFPAIAGWDMVDVKLDEKGEPVLDKKGEPVTVPLPVTLEILLNDVPDEIVIAMINGMALDQAKDADAGNAPLTP